jgi:hypothetical protein
MATVSEWMTGTRRSETYLESELLSVGELPGGVRESVGLSSEGVRPHESHVSQSSDSNDGDLLSGSDLESLHGRVGGDTSAHEGSGVRR